MYIIFNKDGSVKETQLNEYVNQRSSGVNFIDVSVDGYDPSEYIADGVFVLPNGDLTRETGVYTTFKDSQGERTGYRITLMDAETEYLGEVKLSLNMAFGDGRTLYTYRVSIVVNETTEKGGVYITYDQYEALLRAMTSYQLRFDDCNYRGYKTLAEAEYYLKDMKEGQLFAVGNQKDGVSIYAVKDGKIVGCTVIGVDTTSFLSKTTELPQSVKGVVNFESQPNLKKGGEAWAIPKKPNTGEAMDTAILNKKFADENYTPYMEALTEGQINDILNS